MRKHILSIALAAVLVAPLAAFAASLVVVDDVTYDSAQSDVAGSGGGTWSWDGADDMTLNNYSGSNIYADGELTITLEGENHVEHIEQWDVNATLTIKGDEASSLDVDHPEGSNNGGHINSSGDLVLDTVDLNLNDGSIEAGASVTIKDSEIDGERRGVALHVNTKKDNGAEKPYLTIDNSRVHLVNTNESETEGEYSFYTESAVLIEPGNDDTGKDLLEDYMKGKYYTDDVFDIGKFAADYPELDAKIPEKYKDPANPWDYFELALSWFSTTDQGQKLIDASNIVKFVNVEGDLGIRGSLWKGYSYVLIGPDEDNHDILIEPIPEPEPTPTPAPAPAPEPDSKPTPPPVPSTTVLPKTADAALLVEGSIAASGTLLALAGILRRRRQA